MKWQEVIHIRATTEGMRTLERVLPERCLALHQLSGLEGAELYSAGDCDADLVLILRWDIEHQAPEKSQSGLLLAEYLEKFGMVNHKVLKQIFPAPGVSLRGGY